VDRVEEEIEQHGLSAADPAIEIEPLWRRPPPPRERQENPTPRLAIVRQAIGEEL